MIFMLKITGKLSGEAVELNGLFTRQINLGAARLQVSGMDMCSWPEVTLKTARVLRLKLN